MAKQTLDMLYDIFEKDVCNVTNEIYRRLVELFKYEMGLSTEEYDEFVKYWNERVEKENAELEATEGGQNANT
jgi:hypothetical protein